MLTKIKVLTLNSLTMEKGFEFWNIIKRDYVIFVFNFSRYDERLDIIGCSSRDFLKCISFTRWCSFSSEIPETMSSNDVCVYLWVPPSGIHIYFYVEKVMRRKKTLFDIVPPYEFPPIIFGGKSVFIRYHFNEQKKPLSRIKGSE